MLLLLLRQCGSYYYLWTIFAQDHYLWPMSASSKTSLSHSLYSYLQISLSAVKVFSQGRFKA